METASQAKSSASSAQLLESTRTHANQGDAESQFLLGVYYGATAVERQDLPQSADWYRKAAEQDHALAQFNLGVIYSRGQGVVQDEGVSTMWMQKAAKSGDAGAQFHLGTLCHRASLNRTSTTAGDQRIESFKWFQLAAAQDFPASIEFRDRITNDMSWAEVAEGNSRARRFGTEGVN